MMQLNTNRDLYKLLALLFCAFLCSIALLSHAAAEAETIEAEGVYIMGHEDSPALARERAEMSAIRAACEKAGVMVESLSKTESGALTDDEIRTQAANFVEVLEKDITIEAQDANTLVYHCRILATVDSDKAREITRQKDRAEN